MKMYSGSNVLQKEFKDGTDFTFKNVSNYKIIKTGNGSKVIDFAWGTTLIEYNEHGGGNQRFNTETASDPGFIKLTYGSGSSKRCFTARDSDVVLQSCSSAENQMFREVSEDPAIAAKKEAEEAQKKKEEEERKQKEAEAEKKKAEEDLKKREEDLAKREEEARAQAKKDYEERERKFEVRKDEFEKKKAECDNKKRIKEMECLKAQQDRAMDENSIRNVRDKSNGVNFDKNRPDTANPNTNSNQNEDGNGNSGYNGGNNTDDYGKIIDTGLKDPVFDDGDVKVNGPVNYGGNNSKNKVGGNGNNNSNNKLGGNGDNNHNKNNSGPNNNELNDYNNENPSQKTRGRLFNPDTKKIQEVAH